jgi:hypothetical protein
MGFGDAALVYDGNDPFAVTPDEYTGNLGNVLQWSTNVDNSLLLAIDAGEGWVLRRSTGLFPDLGLRRGLLRRLHPTRSLLHRGGGLRQ